MKLRKFNYLLIIVGLGLPALTIADTTKVMAKSAKISKSKKTSPPAESNFKFSGYIDGSYNYLVRSNHFTSGVFNRVFDITPNGFTLQQAAVTLAYQPKQGFGGLLNPIVGRDPHIFAPYGWDPDYGSQWLGFAIPQAYLQYAVIPSKNAGYIITGLLTFAAGSFLELAGAESLSPLDANNFSRSILYGYAEPFTVMGLRITCIINDTFTLIVGINNGWDNIRDTSRRKTIELSTTYTPNSLFSLAATLYSGGQRATDRTATGPESIRDLIDIVATLNATDKLTFIANYDYGNQTLATLPSGNVAEAVWQGIAGYINYKFNDKWQTSLRGEIFSDRNGYRTGVAQCWKEITLTLGFTPIKNLGLRAETRHDFSNVSSFVNKGRGSNNNQQSYGLEAYYRFA